MAQEEKKKSVLAGVNFATVVASALAAGTSLTLSTYIGIAGSVIGAVVAAAVSSIASQVYQGIINKSADKIKDVADAALTQVVSVATPPSPSADETTVLGQDETVVLSAGDTVVRPRVLDDEPQADSLPQTPIASDELVSVAHEHEIRDHRRRALTVSIVAALIALAITAAAIFALTAGEGIGAKPSFTPTNAEEEADDQDASTVDTDQTEENQPAVVEEAPVEESSAEDEVVAEELSAPETTDPEAAQPEATTDGEAAPSESAEPEVIEPADTTAAESDATDESA